MDKEKRPIHISYLWFVLGIVIFLFSSGRWVVPIAAWLAPLFLLRFVRLEKASRGLIVLFISICIVTFFALYGIIPPWLGMLSYILSVYYALITIFPYLIHKLFVKKGAGFATTLIFPAAAVSVEYINNVFFGSWNSVAYSQFGDLPLMQLASIAGIWGITFLVLWFGACVCWAWEQEFKWIRIRKAVIIYGLVITSALFYGGLRLGFFVQGSNTVRIVSFTPTAELEKFNDALEKNGDSSSLDMARKDRALLRDILTPIHEEMFDRAEGLIPSNASLILWPEGAVRVLEEDEQVFIQQGQELGRAKNVYVALAYFVFPRNDPGRLGENKCVFINPDGRVEWHYLKTYPVPGSTDKPGDGKIPVSITPFGRVGAVICYDMEFTGFINQAGKSDIDIMVVPSWDWRAIDPLHSHMAVFRAVENGFSLVRQAGEGLSLSTDYLGRTLSAMDYFESDDQVLISQVSAKGIRTIYSVIGDLMAWLCIGVLIVFLVFPIIRRRKTAL